MADEPMTEDAMVAALLRERDGYERRNMPDRVAQVDEQLALRGFSPPKRDEAEETKGTDKPAVQDKPLGRRAPSKRTT